MELRSLDEVVSRFSATVEVEAISEVLEGLVAEKLMFSEGGRFLSLAAAPYPHIAAERIRAARAAPGASLSGTAPRAGAVGRPACGGPTPLPA